jgi:hypothetical protein
MGAKEWAMRPGMRPDGIAGASGKKEAARRHHDDESLHYD